MPTRDGRETYTEMAIRIAQVLREHLTEEEFRDVLDLLGDYTTEVWFYRALRGLPPMQG